MTTSQNHIYKSHHNVPLLETVIQIPEVWQISKAATETRAFSFPWTGMKNVDCALLHLVIKLQ